MLGPWWLLERSGAVVRRARASLWVHGETPRQFDTALRLLREVMRARPHVRLVLTSTDPATVAYLRRSFPDDHGGAAPWNASGAVRRFFTKVNPRLLVLLDGGRSLGARAIDEMVARGLPLVAVKPGRDADAELAPAVARA
ncbi:hypothetical protein K2Z84_24010, partial [Candidatus Binatia bacterium]|nr:hypothetical protein [Candidatus Binatia bacterium]